MTRLIYRALNPPAFILLVIIGVAVQTSLFNSYPFLYLQPDLVLLAVIWCSLRREFLEGGILTLVFANIAEIHSAAPQGLFLISYMLVYLAGRMIARYLFIPNLSSLTLLTMGASIFWKLTYFFVLSMLDLSENQWRHLLVLLLPGAVMEGVTGVWVYRWLEKFDWVTFKDPRAEKAVDDEFQLNREEL